jgi:hypothetical protein
MSPIGILEYWNIGRMGLEKCNIEDPLFHNLGKNEYLKEYMG